MRISSRLRHREAGLSLVEILVAVAILAVAATVALSVYELSRRSFKKGENRSEQQQAVRVAFDKLVADLRMTGFNYNPDGTGNRPDEQIEAAYDTAVVIRADFDAEDPTASQNPESTMKGTDFFAVSTGNDEIAAYVLAKPDGSSTGTLTFWADISNPRDGTVERVDVPNVAMIQDDPPYTLYRVTFNNDASTYPNSAFFVRTPLIENVYSMTYEYFNTVGVQANSVFDLTSITDDIGGLETPGRRATRTGLKRINVELVGLTRDPEQSYVDPDDPYTATQAYRKFALSGDVTPRNIGMVGMKDLAADAVPPSKPGTPTLVPGHCSGLLIDWPDNPLEDEVAYYRVNYGTTSGVTTGTRTSTTSGYYLGGLSDGVTYYVTIQAVDASGNVSQKSTESSAATVDVNTPNAPANITATSGLEGVVDIRWDRVTENTQALPAADPKAPRIRDLEGYRVYRGTSSAFVHATLIADESVVQNSWSPQYPDSTVVNCRDFNYWVSAVDLCGNESEESAMATGSATTSTAPAAPEGVQAFLSGVGEVQIVWQPVNRDENGAKIFIDSYRVYRTALMPEDSEPYGDGDFYRVREVTGDTSYTDSVSIPPGYAVYYKVSAIDDCVNESALSEWAKPECSFSGEVVFVQPSDDSPVAGVVPTIVEVVEGSDVYSYVIFEFYHINEGRVIREEKVVGPGPTWYYEWLAEPPGPYRVTATVVNEVGCGKSASIEVAAGYAVGCCLSQRDPELLPIVLNCEGAGSAKCARVSYEIINNNCLTAVAIEAMTIDWVDKTGLKPYITGVRFDGELIWNVSPPEAQPAYKKFDDPKPDIPVERSSVNPVRVTYTYTDNMAIRSGQDTFRNTLTTSFDFRLLDEYGEETSITGTCGPSTGMFDKMIVEAP